MKKTNNRKRNNNKKEKQIDILRIVVKFFFGFLIPFVAINCIILFLYTTGPEIIVEDYNNEDYNITNVKFQVKNVLPITSVTVSKDNGDIVKYTKLNDDYSIPIDSNGSYKITVLSINKMQAVTFVDINAIDDTPPSINTDTLVYSTGTLSFNINDNQSGINYDKVYVKNSSGEEFKPTYVDKSTGMVQFTLESAEGIIIHIEDQMGNSAETNINIAN